MMMPMAVATSMNGGAMEATHSVRILSRNDMKENKNDYQFFLAFMCMMLLMIAMNQCTQAEELGKIADELRTLNIQNP